MDAGILTFEPGSMFDADKTWHFTSLGFCDAELKDSRPGLPVQDMVPHAFNML